MKIVSKLLSDVFVLELDTFHDHRGTFCEAFHQENFKKIIGRDVGFVVDNISRSCFNTLRGLHFQFPNPQAKLIQVIKGEIFDVVVDIRKESPHFGKWAGRFLSEGLRQQIWIPEGFAHGFLSLTEETIVQYKVNQFYAPDCQYAGAWNDPDIGVEWPIAGSFILSEKDRNVVKFPNLIGQKKGRICFHRQRTFTMLSA